MISARPDSTMIRARLSMALGTSLNICYSPLQLFQRLRPATSRGQLFCNCLMRVHTAPFSSFHQKGSPRAV